jgi:glycosyltransferase involved in cell wall biosynthesis
VENKKKFIFSNQYAGYLFIDIVNAFAEHYKCELLTGHYDPIKAQLNPAVKKRTYTRYKKDKTYKRFFTWFMYTLEVFLRLLPVNRKKVELVLVTNPPTVPFIGYLLCKLSGVKYHLIIYDIYPDALVNFNFVRKGSFINSIWSGLNYSLFLNASTIYTLSDNMAKQILTYNPKVKVEVIHNWSDTSHIKPVEKSANTFAIQHNQADKITVMYSGNMGSTHAVERIADLAAAFRNDSSFGFMLIGEGAKKSTIEAMKTAQQLDNLTILTYQPAKIFPQSVACADIGIVTLSAGAEDLSVPSKTYNLLAAGVALLVIAPEGSELGRLVAEYDCGVIFREDQLTEMTEFLRTIRDNKERLDEMKTNSRKASANFTPQNAHEYVARLNSNSYVR